MCNVAGLTGEKGYFELDGKPFRILSGSFHYFRTHPAQWQDRLLKMKAAGLNTVSTYIPWNLHEEKKGSYEFDGRWNIVAFIKAVQAAGLKLIVRPGPYICSEWEFGGLPSWLLANKDIKVRSSKDPRYLQSVEQYFTQLLPIFVPYQYSQGTGPIIAFQIENEFGHYDNDTVYMTFITRLFLKAGIKELLFTSDGGRYLQRGYVPGVFGMVNFLNHVEENLGQLEALQPGRAQMVAEFWVGWFDHWGQKHHTKETNEVVDLAAQILDSGASINFYMFVGGTNFGFWNGANFGFPPTITSYDYDAPISESGLFTPKAAAFRDLLVQKKLASAQDLPGVPPLLPATAYEPVKITEFMPYTDVANHVMNDLGCVASSPNNPQFMENLEFAKGGSAGYGWMIYRAQVSPGRKLTIDGRIGDRAQVLINSKLVQIVELEMDNREGIVREYDLPVFTEKSLVLDILVENTGRINYGRGRGTQTLDTQNKGMQATVLLDGKQITGWKCIPLEFHESFNTKILSVSKAWKPAMSAEVPTAHRAHLILTSAPTDTFIDMQSWTKGIVLVNGFNVGRYWNIGPQQTLYVPYPLLKVGSNEVVISELEKPAASIKFVSQPILDSVHSSLFDSFSGF